MSAEDNKPEDDFAEYLRQEFQRVANNVNPEPALLIIVTRTRRRACIREIVYFTLISGAFAALLILIYLSGG